MERLKPTKLLPKLDQFDYSKWLTKGYRFDYEAVHAVVEFAQECQGTIGNWANEEFEFLDWQLYELIVPVFGIVHEDTGLRRFRTVVFFVPRKNGKSGLMSVILLYLTGFDGENRPFVYGIAKNKQQAKIVFNEAKLMIEGSEWLSQQFITYTDVIKCPLNNGEYRVLSKDSKSKDGLNAHGVCGDEIQEFDVKDEHVVNILHTSSSTRDQPLEFYFGTKGVNKADPPFWKKMYKRAKLAFEHPDKEPSLYPLIFEAEEKCDVFDPKNWMISNPSLGMVKKLDYMKEEARLAALYPSKLSEFKRLELNIETQVITDWISVDKWKTMADTHSWKTLVGRPVYLGIDLSSRRDFAAITGWFPPYELDPYHRIDVKLWLPQAQLESREASDGNQLKYIKWQQQGFFEATPGDVIDFEAIENFILDLHPIYQLRGLAIDPWLAEHFLQSVKRKGERRDGAAAFWAWFFENRVMTFQQGYKSMSEPSKNFEVLVYNKDGLPQVKNPGNEVLDWMLGNVVMVSDAPANLKPDKDKSSDKIDGIVSSIMAGGICDIFEGKPDINKHINSEGYSL